MHSRAQGGAHARGGGCSAYFAPSELNRPMARDTHGPLGSLLALAPPVSKRTWGVDIDPAPAQRGPMWSPTTCPVVFNYSIENSQLNRRVFSALRRERRSVGSSHGALHLTRNRPVRPLRSLVLFINQIELLFAKATCDSASTASAWSVKERLILNPRVLGSGYNYQELHTESLASKVPSAQR